MAKRPKDVFGLAQTKQEGADLPYDSEYLGEDAEREETFWFEQPFTKRQFAQLAFVLRNEAAPWLVELRKTLEACAINGWGGF